MKYSEHKILKGLKEISLKTGLTVNELRVILALERAVARMEAEPNFSKHLIFKGGFVLLKSIDTTRYTRDVDALASGIALTEVAKLMAPALYRDLSDCVWFRDVIEAPLPNQGPYGGLQFSVAFQIADNPPKDNQIKKLSRIHIDIGFGDSIQIPQNKSTMVSLLPQLADVSWLVYPLESVFAEKLEAMLRRGSANSRAKDIYDMVLLYDKCKNKEILKTAIMATFRNRNMKLPQSFEKAAKEFDTEILSRAWESVVIMGSRKTFEETRAALLGCLRRLDDSFLEQLN